MELFFPKPLQKSIVLATLAMSRTSCPYMASCLSVSVSAYMVPIGFLLG